MGLFGSLLGRVFGKPAGNPYAPAVASRVRAVHAQAAIDATAGWTKVKSSNVDAIRWFAGRAVLGVKDPENKAQPGPKGGAATLGGIKTADESTHTAGVPVAFSSDAKVSPDTLGTLEVRFQNGSVYQYFNVPNRVFGSFVAAPSKGKFVWANLRGKFTYRRVA